MESGWSISARRTRLWGTWNLCLLPSPAKRLLLREALQLDRSCSTEKSLWSNSQTRHTVKVDKIQSWCETLRPTLHCGSWFQWEYVATMFKPQRILELVYMCWTSLSLKKKTFSYTGFMDLLEPYPGQARTVDGSPLEIEGTKKTRT